MIPTLLLPLPIIGIYAPSPRFSQTDLRSVAADLAKQLLADMDILKLKKETLVVAEFENINGQGDAVPRIFQDFLISDFIRQKHFKVIERGQLNKALAELKLGVSDLYDPSKVKSLGKQTGAAYILMGSVSDVMGKVYFTARVVSIETGESIASADVAMEQSVGSSAIPSGAGNKKTIPEEVIGKEVSSVSPQKTNVDLNAKSTGKSAGKWLVTPPDFGLLQASNLEIDWSIDFPSDKAVRFAIGDFYNDENKYLLVLEEADGFDKGHFPSGYYDFDISLWSFQNQILKKIWVNKRVMPRGKYLKLDSFEVNGKTFGTLSEFENHADSMVIYENKGQFIISDIDDSLIFIDKKGNKIINSYGNIYKTDFTLEIQNIKDFKIDDKVKSSLRLQGFSGVGGDYIYPIVGNIDGFTGDEIGFLNISKNYFEIYSLENKKIKNIIENIYDKDSQINSKISIWYVNNQSAPLIIFINNKITDDKITNGQFFILRFTGKTYEKVFESNSFGEEILDIKVGDLKKEGKEGLVILSRSKGKVKMTKVSPH